jgi:hypothetical protein
MKLKFILFFLILILGYSQIINKSKEVNKIVEQPLKIAVVGTGPPYDFENIEWIRVSIDELFDNKGHYDALFIMEETFLKTSQAKYAELYKELPYPSFFIGLNEPYEAFIDEKLTISDFAESGSMAFAQGYFNGEHLTKTWIFVPPTPLKSKHDYRLIYKEIFNSIIDFHN